MQFRLVVCSQMFNSAEAFSQNVAKWNVVRVTTLVSVFAITTALDTCYKKGIYIAWGATLQDEYPSWSWLCTPFRCERRLTHGNAW